MKLRHRCRGLLSAIAVLPLIAVSWLGAAPAAAAPAPAEPEAAARPASTYSADALPTAQINGVVWDQVVVGDVVYVTGQFSQARPAGAAEGEQETPRSNIMAYTLSTGELVEGFAPTLNGPGRSLSVSDDGSTLYVSGSFNQVDGKWHNNLAAFDLTNGGALIDSFKPVFNTTVSTIDVVGSTVYAGGYFKSVNGESRQGLAAVDAATGATRDWTASISGENAQVYSLRVSPDGSKVVVGGSFEAINGSSSPGYGLALLDATTAEILPTPVNDQVRNAGKWGAIYDVEVDANGFYGTGYSQSSSSANIEGAFRADWNGELVWLEPCHGDTYSLYPTDSQVYVTNHAHSCETIGGFPDIQEQGANYLRFKSGMAFTNSPDVTIGSQGTGNYHDWSGYKSPDILEWYPDLGLGSYTGLYQAAWDVTGTSDYILLAGEFTSADGKPQQGLVRYPRRGTTATHAPEGTGADLSVSVTSDEPGKVKASFNPTWDRDDSTLTYSLYRDDASKPAASTTVSDRYWNRSAHTVEDTAAPGGEHSYKLVVSDPGGNTISSDPVKVTVEPGAEPPVAVADGFDRNVESGWGDADQGGAWTISKWSHTSVADSAGIFSLDRNGWTTSATLEDVSSSQTEVTTDFTLSEAPSKRGVYTTVVPRRTADGYYGVKIVADESGAVSASLIAVESGKETSLGSAHVADGWTPGTPIHVVAAASGSGNTSLTARVWAGDGEAPKDPTLTAQDSTASLQAAGSVGIQSYLSTSASSLTGQLRVGSFSARTADK